MAYFEKLGILLFVRYVDLIVIFFVEPETTANLLELLLRPIDGPFDQIDQITIVTSAIDRHQELVPLGPSTALGAQLGRQLEWL